MGFDSSTGTNHTFDPGLDGISDPRSREAGRACGHRQDRRCARRRSCRAKGRVGVVGITPGGFGGHTSCEFVWNMAAHPGSTLSHNQWQVLSAEHLLRCGSSRCRLRPTHRRDFPLPMPAAEPRTNCRFGPSTGGPIRERSATQ